MMRTLEELKAETYNHDLSTREKREAWLSSLEPEERAIFEAEIIRVLCEMEPLAYQIVGEYYIQRRRNERHT